MRTVRFLVVAALGMIAAVTLSAGPRSSPERHFLYVAEPGIRNYVEYGGVGVLVFDMDHGYKFVRRIPSQDVPAGKEPENVKGIAANAQTGRLYVTTFRRVMAFDLATDRRLWDQRDRRRLRSAGDLARRQDALRAVARRAALERGRRRDRRRHREGRHRTPARTTRSTVRMASGCTWPA